MTFGEKVTKLREEKGYSKVEFAEKVGITNTMIGFIEKNEKIPSLAVFKQIVTVLGVSADYLLGTDEKERSDGK